MWDFLSAFLELLEAIPPWRVTVKDRYEMKERVRKLKARERLRAEKPSKGDRRRV